MVETSGGDAAELMSATLRTIAFAAVLSSCAGHTQRYIWAEELPDDFDAAGEYRIQPGDRITVLVKNQQQLSGEYEVRPNGGYLQPLIGEILVQGLTAPDAAQRIATLFKGIVVSPLVAVSVSSPRPNTVSVIGEVRTPGSYALPRGEGVLGILARAGGLTEFADDDDIYVLRKSDADLSRIRFDYDHLAGGCRKSNSFELRDGDIVIVE